MGDPAELSAAIDSVRAELDGLPERRLVLLARLSYLTWEQYRPLRGSKDPAAQQYRQAAVEAARAALEELPAGRPERGVSGYVLSTVEWHDFVATGDLAALDRAIDLAEAVVRDPGKVGEANARGGLGQLLFARWNATRAAADLDRAIEEYDRALRLGLPAEVPPELAADWRRNAAIVRALAHAERWRAAATQSGFDAATRSDSGAAMWSDFDAAITGLEEVAAAGPLPVEGVCELVRLLIQRAARAGPASSTSDGAAQPVRDLGAAVRLATEALDRAGQGGPLHARLFAEATMARWAHYLRTRDPAELTDLDSVAAAAIAATDPGTPERWMAEACRAQAIGELEHVNPAGVSQEQRVWRDETTSRLPKEVPQEMLYRLASGGAVGRAWQQLVLPENYLFEQLKRIAERRAGLPEGHPDRADTSLAEAFGGLLTGMLGMRDMDFPRMLALLDEARRGKPDDQEWQSDVGLFEGAIKALTAVNGDVGVIDEVVRRLATHRGAAPAGGAPEVDAMLAVALQVRSRFHGTMDDAAASAAPIERMAAQADAAPTGPERLSARILHAVTAASASLGTGDEKSLRDTATELEACLAELAEGDVRRVMVLGGLADVKYRQARHVPGRDPEGLRRIAKQLELAAENTPLPPAVRTGLLGQTARIAAFASLVERLDPAELDEVGESMRSTLDTLPEAARADQRMRAAFVDSAIGEYLRSRAHWDRAISDLESVLADLPDPGDHRWSEVTLHLAKARRSRGDQAQDDAARSRELGLRSLQGDAWKVLIQSGARHAAVAGAEAAGKAIEVAGWCVTDGEAEQAARALDAGRGLLLHAAATATDLADQLRAVNRPDLAAQWAQGAAEAESAGPEAVAGARAAAGEPNLRRLVLRTLVEERDGAGAWLLDPPSLSEVRQALVASSAQALVYLVPESRLECPAVAVVVPARGESQIVHLPDVGVGSAGLNTQLRAGGPDRDLVPHNRRDDPAGVLRDLAAWAWSAAMDPVLAYCRRSELPRPYRLVLVPMGELGLVPWHAARSPSGRVVVRDAVISYAASARLFCDTARRRAIPVRAGSLIVGDPTGDLSHAGVEAAAIHQRMYPDGPFLGRRAAAGRCDGAGTPGEVLGWLRYTLDNDGGMLHLACHATVEPGTADSSYLTLAGADGRNRLSAESLLAQAQRSGRPYRLGTVVLAACSTGVSGHGYDEAFSLSTAFLAAGARSVIGSLWPVPDTSTSLLMYMLHHYLTASGMGPVRALRRAQMWMLDPGRCLPAGTSAELAAQASSIDPEDLAGWAGFTHLGQW